MEIHRAYLIQSAQREFLAKPIDTVKRLIRVTFKGEYGIDVGILSAILTSLLIFTKGGLRREFYTIINEELFDPKEGLFFRSLQSDTLCFASSSKDSASCLAKLELAGIVLAKVRSF